MHDKDISPSNLPTQSAYRAQNLLMDAVLKPNRRMIANELYMVDACDLALAAILRSTTASDMAFPYMFPDPKARLLVTDCILADNV